MRITSTVLTALSAGAFALAGSAASAQQQPAQQPQRPQVVTQFDNAIVTYLLQDVQATWRTEPTPDGHTNYRASAEGGINFTLAPRACSPETGCLGLMMLAVFTGVNAPSMAQLDAFINDFNDKSPTVKVFRNADGVVILQAYVNSAYGITYRNAQNQLLVFGQDIVALSRALARFERGG